MVGNKTEKITGVTEGSIKLTAADLLGLLWPNGPTGAMMTRVYFTIPGGGDRSNMQIDIDDENPIRVDWKIQEVVDG